MEKVKKEQKPKLFITIEDEEALIEAGVPAIVPVVFCRYKSKIELECYYGIYPQARDFLLNCENPFSKESLLYFDSLITPYLREIGYARPEQGKLRYYRSFVLWKEGDLKKEAILPSSKMLTRGLLARIKRNDTDFDLEELIEKGLPAAVTVVDGTLVSLATVNEHSEGQRLLEATVYTLPAHRAKGYGASNVALLSRTLLKKKKGVVYCCSCRNAPSVRLARSLGFKSESRFYAVDAYKIGYGEQEDGET